AVFEIATDKVDSEVPSEVDGILVEKLFDLGAIVKVGQNVAIIETDSDSSEPVAADYSRQLGEVSQRHTEAAEETVNKAKEAVADEVVMDYSGGERFYSPLVRNIARQEGISLADLDRISGSGSEGRVTKNDILEFIAAGKSHSEQVVTKTPEPEKGGRDNKIVGEVKSVPVPVNGDATSEREQPRPDNGDEYIP